jgi:hypothetical protein
MTLVSGTAFSALDPAAALLERTNHSTEAAEFLTALTKAEPWNVDAKSRLAQVQRDSVALTAAASSRAASYSTRVSAAGGIRKIGGTPLSGVDAELDLLSSQVPLGTATITNPYAFESRFEAAMAAGITAAQQANRLQAAVAINPAPLTPKLALLRAALATRRDALAIAVGAQLLPPYFSADSERPFAPWMAQGLLGEVPENERGSVARGLAEANRRLGNLRESIFLYQVARDMDRIDVAAPMAAVRAQMNLEARNNARRPLVSKNLDQDRLVRPRLTR